MVRCPCNVIEYRIHPLHHFVQLLTVALLLWGIMFWFLSACPLIKMSIFLGTVNIVYVYPLVSIDRWQYYSHTFNLFRLIFTSLWIQLASCLKKPEEFLHALPVELTLAECCLFLSIYQSALCTLFMLLLERKHTHTHTEKRNISSPFFHQCSLNFLSIAMCLSHCYPDFYHPHSSQCCLCKSVCVCVYMILHWLYIISHAVSLSLTYIFSLHLFYTIHNMELIFCQKHKNNYKIFSFLKKYTTSSLARLGSQRHCKTKETNTVQRNHCRSLTTFIFGQRFTFKCSLIKKILMEIEFIFEQ